MKQERIVLIQVDGFSQQEFERACKNGKCPNMQRISQQQDYVCKTFYPGLPSSTPAVQAEIFYGERCAVPAFGFLDREENCERTMHSHVHSAYIEKNLAATRKGLLSGGSSYSNVYTGGAEETHVVPAKLINLRQHVRHLRDLGILSVWGWLMMTLRILIALPIELVYALARAIEGGIHGYGWVDEFKMIPTRLLLALFTREVIKEGVCQDMSRGLPIVHANFLAYDEASHRRGPASVFAHSMVGMIDGVIGEIEAYRKKNCPEYKLVIYSDHGQEAVQPFAEAAGDSLENAIKEAMIDHDLRYEFTLCDKGPIGLLYAKESMSPEVVKELATVLSDELPIGGAMFRTQTGEVYLAVDGEAVLIDEEETLFPEDSASLVKERKKDLKTLATCKYAADITLLGWRPTAESITFAQEYGAHAGPGTCETKGFILTNDAALQAKEWIRPLDIYERFA